MEVAANPALSNAALARRRETLLTLRRIGLPVAAAALFLLVWEAGTRWAGIPEVLLPPPSAVLDRLVGNFPLLMTHAWPTIWQSLAGFAIATVLGIVLASLLSASTLIRETLYPNVVYGNALHVPSAVVYPVYVEHVLFE